MKETFRKYAAMVAAATGTASAFLTAVLIILVWALTGPLFHFSDTWQLVINTSTTIITFLMVFLIQNTQNRDAKAIHLKLDELIRAHEGARNNMIDLEHLTDDELEVMHREFMSVAKATVPGPDNAPTDAPPADRGASRRVVQVAQKVASAVEHEMRKRRPHAHDHKK